MNILRTNLCFDIFLKTWRQKLYTTITREAIVNVQITKGRDTRKNFRRLHKRGKGNTPFRALQTHKPLLIQTIYLTDPKN